MCTHPPRFSAVLSYMACNNARLSVLPTVAELSMHADFCSSTLSNVDFIRLFDWRVRAGKKGLKEEQR